MALLADKIDLLLDPSRPGGLNLTGGRLNLSSGLAAVAQAALIRVRSIKGEWFNNLEAGVAYYESPAGGVAAGDALLGQKFDRAKAETAIRTALESTPNVVSVLLLAITFDHKTRKMSSSWRLRTLFGDTPIAQVTA